MATTALPRPSLGPPTGPLPSLPVAKIRQQSLSNPSTPSSSSAFLPGQVPPSIRTPSSSLPTRSPATAPTKKSHTPTPSVPQNKLPTAANSARTLRKTVSIGSFPQPPKANLRLSSQASSPTSITASPIESAPSNRLPSGTRNSSSRESSLRRVPPRTSSRANPIRSYSTTPSLLNGGDGKSVSLLNLPSPPQSRASSAQGSYIASPGLEEADSDERRGRQLAEDKTEADKFAKDGKGNVIVSVRVRPDAPGNESSKSDLEWMVDGRRSMISYRGREGGEYQYDNAFTVHDQNAKVYDAAAKRLVRRVMEGYHGTVFAYGMTGTGKTFSMQGTATSPGVIPLAITDIFSFIRETPHREFLLRVSYLEIYNEKIYDLLSMPATSMNGQVGPQEEIKLREDSKRGVYASPLKEEIVQSPTQLLRVIARGDSARRVAGTQYNARSSRSHAVVQIVVESRERAPPTSGAQDSKRQGLMPGGVRVSTLSLIDLAGSERAAESKERRTEGAHINKSLLTLGNVISKLSGDKEKAANASDKDGKHLPYRDSKLTRLLQPALQGNSLISILCTIQIGSAGSVASAQNHTAETLNTLKFASRAKNNIVSHAKKAEEAFANGPGDPGSRALLDRYRVEIVELRKQLEAQNKATKADETEKAEKAKELEQEQRHEEQMLEMQLARTALKERIEHLNRLILSSKSLGVNSARSFSSLSMRHNSIMTNGEIVPRSARSSTATLDASLLQRNSSASGSIRSFRQSGASGAGVIAEGDAEDEDSLGDNGDGTATQSAQIRALQADLADRNRYISTLEKRLLQARRSSHSRVSMQFSPRVGSHDEGGFESVLREKDSEIADLRSRLDDKDRMVSALRSAARKRDTAADLALDTSVNRSSSDSATSSAAKSKSTASPVTRLSPSSPTDKRGKNVDEMTRLLDEMITERVHQNGDHRVDSGIGVKTTTARAGTMRAAVEG